MIDPDAFQPSDDPAETLATVVALRRLADRLERQAVAAALGKGWSWARIAQALGVTKQAAHKRLSDLVTGNER
ncbi:helix-turn-helix domain-containing protein [Ensifer sp. M14]|uniref:helix-turn-helix domain-containing protein n=1 Tax=Ensifer sp. M14 TaxID=2203782 RepID=UPI000E1C8999|nr:helix-turn-helix domain-containing protein [Ensifer sp. M14]